MNAATLFMLVFLNQGHWLSGQQATISVQAMVEAEQTRVFIVEWELAAGAARLASGTAASRDGKATVAIDVPEVRTRTSLLWIYRTRTTEGKVLSSGSTTVSVYPKQLTEDLSAQYANRTVNLLELHSDLAALVKLARIKFQPINDISKAMLIRPDVLIIGPHAPQAALEPGSLQSLAAAGAQILVLRQEGKSVAGYPLTKGRSDQKFDWRMEHPLLSGVDVEMLDGWVRGSENPPILMQVPPEDASLEIGYRSLIAASERQPIDAIILEKNVGSGRLVFLQLPCATWSTDPRSQILLTHALQYMTERPIPTPAPSRRSAVRAVQPTSVPTITIPSGDSK